MIDQHTLDEIKRLESRATPGAWENGWNGKGGQYVLGKGGQTPVAEDMEDHDAELIVALRNNALALVEEVERLRNK